MSRLARRLGEGHFVVTAEIAPPKGIDIRPSLDKAELLRGLDGINVTDNQGACMRMAPLALARLLVEAGYQPILQVTCRDRNRMALQADILAAAALGIENLLLLTGDHPRFGDHAAARAVFDLDSVQLLRGVRDLQQGLDMAGCRLQGAPSFFVGAAAAPASEPQELMLRKVDKKIACGAQFFQTQAVFEQPRIEAFTNRIRDSRVPVIMGVALLKNLRLAQFLNERIPGVQVPQDLLKRLEAADDQLAEGVRIARQAVAWARQHCQGVHLMTFGREDLIPRILDS